VKTKCVNNSALYIHVICSNDSFQ